MARNKKRKNSRDPALIGEVEYTQSNLPSAVPDSPRAGSTTIPSIPSIRSGEKLRHLNLYVLSISKRKASSLIESLIAQQMELQYSQ
jgi:hypothetical protein